MLMAARRAQTFADQAPGSPVISPSHTQLDKRHPDLSFSIDTRGKPFYRVLITKDRALFRANRQADRNASNFYDSVREGLLPFDAAPCFYLVPRAVINAMLPATAIYYTLIAYEDREATRATYAHAPDSLDSTAPSVAIAGDVQSFGLSTMFGTPVDRLFRYGSPSALDAGDEEVGEDLADSAAMEIGLDAGDDEGDAEGNEAAHAAALDGERLYDGTRSFDTEDDAGEDVVRAESFADDDELRAPVLESAQDYEDDESSQSLADDYNDGFETPIESSQGDDDEPGEDSSYAAYSSSYHDGYERGLSDRMPDQLPDEEADPQGSAQANSDDDGIELDGQAGAYALDEFDSSYGNTAALEATRANFDIDACKSMLARIMPFESGSEGFSRINADGEFAGRFGTSHPAHQRWHLGLSFGAFPFVQEHGTLGQLLALMSERDRPAFDRIFGQDSATLLQVTNIGDGPHAWESADGLSPRLQNVGGAPLWQEPWLTRFRDAGRHPPFQGAQNELAARLYVQSMLPLAAKLGLDSEQALTLVVDRAVQMGPMAASEWIVEAVSPIQSPAQRQQALDRLQFSDLRAFQQAKGLPATGSWDARTHVELLGALRTRNDSPIPIPAREQMLDAMARRAEGTPWAERMRRLRAATSASRLFQL